MDLALADGMPPPGVGADEPAERAGSAALTWGSHGQCDRGRSRCQGYRDPLLDVGRRYPAAVKHRQLHAKARKRAALQGGQQGHAEQFEDHGRGERVPWDADHRDRGVSQPESGPAARNLALAGLLHPGVPEQHRMTGPHRDAVYGFGADLAEDRRSVVVSPGAGPRQDQHQVSYCRGAPDCGRDRGRVIGLYLGDRSPGANLGRARGEHDRVAVYDVALSERRAHGPDFVSSRDDRDYGLLSDNKGGVACRGGCGQVCRAQPPSGRDEQRPGDEILATGAHVQAPRRWSRHDRAAIGSELGLLPCHHGVRPAGYRIPGIDPGEPGGRNHLPGRGRAGDRYAVHRRAVAPRRRPPGSHRLGQDPVAPVGDVHLLGRRTATPTCDRACLGPPGVGMLRAEAAVPRRDAHAGLRWACV